MPSSFLPCEVAQCFRIWFCLCYVYARMNCKVLVLKTVELPHQGHNLNRPGPILPLVFELPSYLRDYLCPWVRVVMQIKLFFLQVHSSCFTNSTHWRTETLPNQTGMFHNSPAKDIFFLISYRDECATVNNSPVMTLIKYRLQTCLKGFTEILILGSMCVNQLPKYHAS